MNKKLNINKYSFWIVSSLLIIAMIIINSTLKSSLSDFGCIVAIFIAEIMIWIFDIVCFGYKDSTAKLWLSGGVVSIIVGISIVVLGGIFIDNFETLDASRPWMFMASIITLIYIVSAHHTLLNKSKKK